MKAIMLLALAGLMAAAPPAFAQTAPKAPQTKVAGVVTAVKGDELDLTGADGAPLVVALGDKTRIALSVPITIDDIKPGSYVGAGAMADGKGGNTAMEITVFPEASRGLGEGFRKWDQGPDSTMTNGTVSEVVGTSNRTITVTYKGGKQSVTIPDATPIVTFSNGDRSALVAGAHVIVRATTGSDGKLAAGYVSVGKDGSTPPG